LDKNMYNNNEGKLNIPLVNRELTGKEREFFHDKVRSIPSIILSKRELSDLEMIATGGFSPLEGFLTKDAYERVVDNMRLPSGIGWTIPITLSVTKKQGDTFQEGTDIALLDTNQVAVGILHLEDRYIPDRDKEALKVYGTKDENHPGVSYISRVDPVCLGGKISLLRRTPPLDPVERKYLIDPREMRKIFKKRGWKRIVGFQTRNPPHRGHEYIQKAALETCDGLLLHPLVGATKKGDITSSVRMRCYEVLFDQYYPDDRVCMSVLPTPMHYAGPREAVHHAIIRRNFGCTHFIVGRDHAGVGDFYGAFDAQYIFREFDIDRELGIRPLFFDHSFYCKRCENMTSYKTCPHNNKDHIMLSGTKVRAMLKEGKTPPKEFMRHEIAEILVEAIKEEIVFNI
jgi:sulfate adenylyltransferase